MMMQSFIFLCCVRVGPANIEPACNDSGVGKRSCETRGSRSLLRISHEDGCFTPNNLTVLHQLH